MLNLDFYELLYNNHNLIVLLNLLFYFPDLGEIKNVYKKNIDIIIYIKITEFLKRYCYILQ